LGDDFLTTMVDVFFDLLGGAFEEVGIDGECDESE
jgi:hypothetical protein